MTIEFDKIELEGDAAEALKSLQGNEVFTKYVADSVANREEAVRKSALGEIEPLKKKVESFRTNNLTLKEQLEAFDGFDAGEYKRLKSLGSDANAASEQMKRQELEHKGQMEGAAAQIAELTGQVTELGSARQDDAFRFDAQAAIQRHGNKYEAVAVLPEAASALVENMMKHRKIIDGKVVMMDGDKEFTTDEGIGTIDDWINTVGRKQYGYMYNKPTGAGAPGSGGNGSGGKQISRTDFNGASPTRQRELIASGHTVIDN